MPNVVFEDLGLIDYKEAWDYQEKRFNEILDVKKNNRKENRQDPTLSYLLFCEHPHVYTLGKSGDENNLLVNEDYLNSRGATFYKINRGGDITYHGPGQLVGYPILDLSNYKKSVSWYMRSLEQLTIDVLNEFKITAKRVEGLTGVWVGDEKIAAQGVRLTKWITMHGFSININTDLSFYDGIIPCGIFNHGVTSMKEILNKTQKMEKVKSLVIDKFNQIFVKNRLKWQD